MLRSERYVGRQIWGRTTKAYKGGTEITLRVERPEELIVAEMPELRIVDQDLWNRVREREVVSRRIHGKVAKSGKKPSHLLSGLARCAECGGPIRGESGKHGSSQTKLYACSYHRTRGKRVCSNTLRRPIVGIDKALLGWIENEVLREEVILETIGEVRRRLAERAATSGPDLVKLEAEKRKLTKEIANLAESIASLGHSKALADKIGEREARLARVDGQIEAARAAPGAIELETHRLEAEARKRLKDLRCLLKRNTAEARKALEALFDGPLRFTPIRDEKGPRYRIQGKIRTGVLCAFEDLDLGSEPPGDLGAQSRTSPRGGFAVSCKWRRALDALRVSWRSELVRNSDGNATQRALAILVSNTAKPSGASS